MQSRDMDSDAFRVHGKEMVEYVASYWETLRDRKPMPDVVPGFMKELVPSEAPHNPEEWEAIFGDLEKVVMSANTNWHHPHFFAYYPTSCSYPSIMADILSGGLGSVGFTWKSGPAMTELEMSTMDWLVSALGLPEHFKNSHSGPGCGVIQSTASDATLVAVMAARARAVEAAKSGERRLLSTVINWMKQSVFGEEKSGSCSPTGPITRRMSGIITPQFYNTALEKLIAYCSDQVQIPFLNRVTQSGVGQTVRSTIKKILAREEPKPMEEEDHGIIDPHFHDPAVFDKFIAYCSDQAHSSVEKGVMLCGVKLRKLQSVKDAKLNNFTVTADALEKAIKEDRARGLIPFIFVASMGSTNTCAVDFLTEVGPICNREGIWLHVDAAYAGAFLLCDEFRYMSEGIEMVDSFNLNAHKAMMVNFDCSPMWFKDGNQASRYFSVDALYLKHGDTHDIDHRHLQVALGSRFRSLKLWFVMRSLGVSTIQEHLRWLNARAAYFASLIEADDDFDLFVPAHLGLVCFKLTKGGNAATEALLAAVNVDNRVHMVPASVHGTFFIRLAVCTTRTTDNDIRFTFDILKELAQPILKGL